MCMKRVLKYNQKLCYFLIKPSNVPSSFCICIFASSLSLWRAILAISRWFIIFSLILERTKDPVMKWRKISNTICPYPVVIIILRRFLPLFSWYTWSMAKLNPFVNSSLRIYCSKAYDNLVLFVILHTKIDRSTYKI